MRNNDIDDILGRAAQAPEPVDPAVLARVTTSIGASLKAVRPLPSRWILAGVFIVLAAAAGIGTAVVLGTGGWDRLSVMEAVVIFSALAVLLCVVGAVCVSQIVPGSRWYAAPALPLVAGAIALSAIFAVLFRDYATPHFIASGYPCLRQGLEVALPTGLLLWLLLRRGFAVHPAGAGLAAGTLAGLAGLTMLEMHCAYFSAPHVVVWHVGVIPIAAAAGGAIGWAIGHFRR